MQRRPQVYQLNNCHEVIDVKYDCLTLHLYRYYIGVSLGYKADTPWDKDTHLTV